MSQSTLVERVTPAGKSIDDLIVAEAASVLFCTDFDGTLAPIVDNPEDARPAPGAIAAIAELTRHLGTVAIITGRDASTVVRLAGLDGLGGVANLLALGQYGVESWDGASGRVQAPPQPQEVRAAIEAVDTLISQVCASGVDTRGVRVEDKGRAVGVHTRQTSDPAGVLQALTPGLQKIAGRLGLHAEPGRNVLELRASKFTKGDAIAKLIDQRQPTVVVMAGDDLGDLAAFDVVEAWQRDGKPGAKVASGSQEQPAVAKRADVICQGPEGVVAWLDGLVKRLSATRTSQAVGDNQP